MITYDCKVLMEGDIRITCDKPLTKDEIEKLIKKYGLDVIWKDGDTSSFHKAKLVELKEVKERVKKKSNFTFPEDLYSDKEKKLMEGM